MDSANILPLLNASNAHSTTTAPASSVSEPSKEEESNLTLKLLQELCEYPVLYVNIRLVESENPCADKHFAITISNKEPEVQENVLEAKYPADSIAADVFFSYDTSQLAINISMHWVKVICSILTFRGHEVIFNNKVFNPFETAIS